MRSKPLNSAVQAGVGGLLLWGLAACGGETTTLTACVGDRSCPAPTNDLPWAVQILPAPNSGSAGDGKNLPLAQDEGHLVFDRDGVASVRLRGTALVTGSVSDANGQLLVGAHIAARLESSIPGQNDYNTSSVTTEVPRGAFSLRIPLSASPMLQPYELWLSFDDPFLASLSPPQWRREAVFADRELPLRLPPLSEMAVVTGRITNALGEGVANLSVQAFDDQAHLVSSTALSQSGSGTQAGTYRLLIDPRLAHTSGTLSVVVRPSAQDTALPILEASLPLPPPNSQSRVDFAVPSYRKPALYKLPIRGGGPTGLTVAGARVRAQVLLSDAATLKLGHKAYYITNGDSDAEGLARLMLVPAPIGGSNLQYQISVVSPSHVPYASVAKQELQVGPTEGLLGAVVLPSRAEIRGRLLDASGLPVAAAQVVASRIGVIDPSVAPLAAQALMADVPQVLTDVTGRFALYLDPGDIDLEFAHPGGLQARSSLDNLRVGSGSQDLGDIMLPPVTLGSLDVTSPASSPVIDAKIRIFELPDTQQRLGVSCDGASPCSRTGKLRAEAFTGRSGRAQFLLPGGKARLVGR
jgi:hypothetical protein